MFLSLIKENNVSRKACFVNYFNFNVICWYLIPEILFIALGRLISMFIIGECYLPELQSPFAQN